MDNNTPCIHRDGCGGCIYQDISYDEQLKIKENHVRTLIDENISKDYIWDGIIKSPLIYGYRNKMEYSFGDMTLGGRLELGLHKKKSRYDILTTDRCNLVHDDFNQILYATLEYYRSLNITYYHKKKHIGYLRHLLVRRGVISSQIMIDLVTTSGSEDRYLDKWKDIMLDLGLEGNIVSILHTTNNSLSDAVKDEGTVVLYGQRSFDENLLGLSFEITPFSFFQTNSVGAELLYKKVREYVGDISDCNVWDLYCGTGTIAQIVAQSATHVTGIEIVAEAIEAAKVNAKRNNIINCEFICNDVGKALSDIKENPDIIIVDPPRCGIAPKALDLIAGFGVDNIIYVACKPESLARDGKILSDYNYHIQKLCCIDMFPHTNNIETVCLLSK